MPNDWSHPDLTTVNFNAADVVGADLLTHNLPGVNLPVGT